ncbi:MAG TPA: DUF6249 domain-containing protein [Rhizomicrobium sp.]|nr:DUF6249 domain-containing protein [Rhizomicrobium sp.]
MFIFHGSDMGTVSVFWLAVVAVVFITAFSRAFERSRRYRAIEKMAEKGQAVPPEMLNGRGYRDRYPGSPIWHGIYMMCVGVAIFVFLWALSGGGNYFNGESVPSWLPFVGIFPFMIGVARLLAGLFDRRRPD